MRYRGEEKYRYIDKKELERRGYDVLLVQLGHENCYLFGEKGIFEEIDNDPYIQVLIEREEKRDLIDIAMDIHLRRPFKEYEIVQTPYIALLLKVSREFGPLRAFEVNAY